MTPLLIPEKPLRSPFWPGCFNKLKLLGWVTFIFLVISLPKDLRQYILLSPSLVNLASLHDDYSLKNVFHSDNFLFFSLAVPCFDQSRFISFHFILGLILALSPNSTFKQNSTFHSATGYRSDKTFQRNFWNFFGHRQSNPYVTFWLSAVFSLVGVVGLGKKIRCHFWSPVMGPGPN